MTLYLIISKDREPGRYRLQLRQALAMQRPLMGSAAERSVHECKKQAARMFGDGLAWRPSADVGLGGQGYVVEVAVVETGEGVW